MQLIEILSVKIRQPKVHQFYLVLLLNEYSNLKAARNLPPWNVRSTATDITFPQNSMFSDIRKIMSVDSDLPGVTETQALTFAVDAEN